MRPEMRCVCSIGNGWTATLCAAHSNVFSKKHAALEADLKAARERVEIYQSFFSLMDIQATDKDIQQAVDRRVAERTRLTALEADNVRLREELEKQSTFEAAFAAKVTEFGTVERLVEEYSASKQKCRELEGQLQQAEGLLREYRNQKWSLNYKLDGQVDHYFAAKEQEGKG